MSIPAKASQASLRKTLRQQREALSIDDITSHSASICQQIIDHQALLNARHIAIYLPFQGEADPTRLMTLSDAQFYLPVLTQDGSNTLRFAPYNHTTLMRSNRFGILEPVLEGLELIDNPQQLDVVIMPMVGVDQHGNRIGMGGGFYDRTFAYKSAKHTTTPQLIAFAYDFQLLTLVEPNPWDIPADTVATESHFIKCQ